MLKIFPNNGKTRKYTNAVSSVFAMRITQFQNKAAIQKLPNFLRKKGHNLVICVVLLRMPYSKINLLMMLLFLWRKLAYEYDQMRFTNFKRHSSTRSDRKSRAAC